MYSLTNRLSYFMYSGLACLFACGMLCHLQARFGFMVSPELGLEVKLDPVDDLSFAVTGITYFNEDKFYFKGEDALVFTFDLLADLNGIFNWNTNMVFLSMVCEFGNENDRQKVTVWDQRILRTDTENHKLNLQKEYVEYHLTDVQRSLRGSEVTVYLRWEGMSTIGLYYADLVEIGKFTAPDVYTTTQKRSYYAGPSSRKHNY